MIELAIPDDGSSPDFPAPFPAYGIALALYEAEGDYAFEVECAPDLAGAPDVAKASSLGGADANAGVFIDYLPNDGLRRHYRIRHIHIGEDPSPWTAWVSSVPVRLTEDIRPRAPRLPTIREVISESGAAGTLALSVTDPQGRITLVEFRTQSGTGAWSAWTPDYTAPYAASVTLAEKQISRIAYRVTAYDGMGRLGVLAEATVPYSVGATPGIPTIAAAVDASGNIEVTLTGDSDTAYHKIAYRTDYVPTAAEIRATAQRAGRVATLTLAGAVPAGGRAYLGVLAFSLDGTESLKASVVVMRGESITTEQAAGATRAYQALDANGILTTGVGAGATVGSTPVTALERAASSVFLETFENDAARAAWVSDSWTGSLGGITYIGNAGLSGGNVIRVASRGRIAWPQNIKYDPSKLYRIRFRVRMVTDNTSPTGDSRVYLGLMGVASDGVTKVNVSGNDDWNSAHYLAAASSKIVVADGWQVFTGYVRGHGPVGGGPSSTARTDPTAPGNMHSSVRYVRPTLFLNYDGSSNNGNGVCDVDMVDISVIDEYAMERARRTDTIYQGDALLKPLVKSHSAAGRPGKSLVRGAQRGTAKHWDTIVFNPPFVSPPVVILSGGITYQPQSKWGTAAQVLPLANPTAASAPLAAPQYEDLKAENVTNLSCTIVARLRQKGGQTAQATSFPAGNSVTALGSTTQTGSITPGPPAGSLTVRYKIDVTVNSLETESTGVGAEVTYVVAIELDPGNGSFDEVATRTYGAFAAPGGSFTETYHDTISINGTIPNALAKVRLRLKSRTFGNAAKATASAALHGYVAGTDAAAGVSWTTTAGDQFASKTPGTGDEVSWVAYEGDYT